MTIGWLAGWLALCAALYLLGWERGRRGATVWKSLSRWRAGKTRRQAAGSKREADAGTAGPDREEAPKTQAPGRERARQADRPGRESRREAPAKSRANAGGAVPPAGTVPPAGGGRQMDDRTWRELLNFLEYDGTPQTPPDGGHNR